LKNQKLISTSLMSVSACSRYETAAHQQIYMYRDQTQLSLLSVFILIKKVMTYEMLFGKGKIQGDLLVY
jgi:hypothetical protein